MPPFMVLCDYVSGLYLTHSFSGSVEDLRTGGRSFVPPARPIFFLRIDDSQCDKIHTSLTTIICFDDGCVGKEPVAWREYCAGYWLKELQETWIGTLAVAI